jgi:hypothetical protein
LPIARPRIALLAARDGTDAGDKNMSKTYRWTQGRD